MLNSSVGSVRGSEGSEVLSSSGLTFGSEMGVLSLVGNLMGSPFVVHVFGFKRFLEGLGVSGMGINSGHGRILSDGSSNRGDRGGDGSNNRGGGSNNRGDSHSGRFGSESDSLGNASESGGS